MGDQRDFIVKDALGAVLWPKGNSLESINESSFPVTWKYVPAGQGRQHSLLRQVSSAVSGVFFFSGSTIEDHCLLESGFVDFIQSFARIPLGLVPDTKPRGM